jgi:signal transduction histidine kinase
MESNDAVHISIKDDGKGFNTDNVSLGNGLNNMQYRAMEAGYEINIFSSEKGTEIRLEKK